MRVRYVNRRRAVLNSVVMATSTSYERARTNAYSEDLRWRIIYQRLALDYSLQRVADNLGVGVATVQKLSFLHHITFATHEVAAGIVSGCSPS